MIINNINMKEASQIRFEEYIEELKKNNPTIDFNEDVDLEMMKAVFDAGFSGALETLLPKVS